MPRRIAVPAAVVVATAALIAAFALHNPAPPGAGRGGPLLPAGGGSTSSEAGTPGAGPAAPGGEPGRPVVTAAGRHDTSRPLRSIKPKPPEAGEEDADAEEDLPLPGREAPRSQEPRLDPVAQTAPVAAAAATITKSFNGLTNINSAAPPDTNGDIGPNQYIEWVNLSFAIYDRIGQLLYGPAAGNTLWSGFGGPCESTNNGDPIVQYDHLADRWVMTQFALPNYNPPGSTSGPFYQCIAVSQTPNPLLGWYRYQFLISNTKLNDYPHLGVWPDAYYLSINQFNSSAGTWGGAGAVAFERARMLQGLSARMVYFDLFGVDPNLGGMLPSDLDGPAPPSGAPNVYVEADDDANGYPHDQLDLWNFHVNWTTPASSTFSHDRSLLTAAMDTNLCGYSRNCIPQPPFPPIQGRTTQGLDAIADRIMYRLQYRNFGGYRTLVTTQTVDVDGNNHAGIRWFEVRDTGSGWAIQQQGTWAPDAAHRWLGSAAMNSAGDIVVGYSVSSSSIYPSIRVAGRQAADPAGTLTTTEATIMAGGGSQTTTVARWGDYSMLAVDPVDGCTFWDANEYVGTTANADWRTRIAAIELPGCTGNGDDTTAPGVVWLTPSTPSPTNATTISYSAAFTENVPVLPPNAFSLGGTATGCTVNPPDGAGSLYLISVSGCSDGTLILGVKTATLGDAAGNYGPASPFTAATVTIDRTGPTATLTTPASPSHATTLAFGVSFNQAVTGLAAGDFTVGGTATGCVVGPPSGSGSSYTVNLTGCSNGTVILTLKSGSVTNAASTPGPATNVSAPAVTVDRTAPTVTAPAASLRSNVQISGATLALQLAWTGSDAGTGIATYDVARSTDGAAFATIATGLTGTTLSVGGSSGHSYRFEVRAHDVAGNTGGYLAGPTLKLALVQNSSTSIGYHGTWTTSSYASYSGGSVRYATAAGAYASYTFTGRSVAFVTTRAASRGQAKIYLDGVLITTVDCYAASSTFRWVAFSRTWATAGTHRITIKVVGTLSRPRVDLDAIEVVQ